MSELTRPTKCYLATFQHQRMDPFYEDHGFSRGMILFAVPEYGILFKCRVGGIGIDLEFAAFFALLRFVTTELEKEKIRSILVHSSNPEFVFSFAGRGRYIEPGSAREKLIQEYGRKLRIAVAYVELCRNPCLGTPTDFPAIPRDRQPGIKPNPDDQNKSQFRPIQKGIKI